MADLKISGLTALTGANTATGDLLEIVDVSDTTMAATGTNKKITLGELMNAGTVPGKFTTLTATGNAALGDAEATDTHAIKGATTLLANTGSGTSALTITQTGAGNAFVVEDSASTDSTPFVVTGDGTTLIGATIAQAALAGVFPILQVHSAAGGAFNSALFANWDVTTGQAATISLAKSVGDAIGTRGAVANAQLLGSLHFLGDDGTAFIRAAQIIGEVDGTPDTNDMPGRLVFSTTADGASSPTERMRIDSAGNVGIGGTAAAGRAVDIPKTITGATSAYGVFAEGTIQSDVTVSARYFGSIATTVASAFTLSDLYHFFAQQSTFGATSAVTNQYGFFAQSNITGATNNYGFYSNIAAAANRYNFYANGSAPNYFAGVTGIGVAAAATSNLTVAAGTTAVSSLNIPHGAAPTSPVNGDMWTTTAGLFIRINGGTVGPLS
jgi:hypothetical protein